MGQRMQWLDDERYIRIAGALLLCSPFFNFFLSVASNPLIPNKWSPAQLFALFVGASALQWILRISKIVVGYLMFRGKSSAWVPVLAILGVTIFLNFYTFKKDIQVNAVQAVLGLIINIILFSIVFRAEFRLNQEVERRLKEVRANRAAASAAALKMPKQQEAEVPTIKPVEEKQAKVIALARIEKSEKKKKPALPKPMAPKKATVVPIQKKKMVRRKRGAEDFVIARGTVVEFEGFGHFAKVIKCNGDELWLKGTKELPKDIQNRSLILDSIDRKKSVRLRFNRTQDEQCMIFKIA